MGPDRDDSHARPLSGLGADLAAHVDAIVRAAEREARAAERAIEQQRRSAEDEVHRYLAAARLRVDAEAAARAARLETLSSAARRLADELADASAALNAELLRGEDDLDAAVPRTPWPSEPRERAPYAPPAPQEPAPRPTWARTADAEPARHDEGPADPFPTGFGAADAPPSEPGPQPASADIPNAARLVAIEMAVGGAPRADVEQHLRIRFGVADPAPLLDDVFGAESHAGSRLAWGEP